MLPMSENLPKPFEPSGQKPRPKRTRVRKDGWTTEAQLQFVTTLSETGSVRAAAKKVGMHAASAYRLRTEARGWEFARAWDAAIDHGYHQLREVAFQRALEGVARPVYHKGEQVDTRIVHNDRLLMFLLTHTAKRQVKGPTDFAWAMISLAKPPTDATAVEKAALAALDARMDAYLETKQVEGRDAAEKASQASR